MAKAQRKVVLITTTGTVTTANKAGILWGYGLIGGTTASKALFKNGGTNGTDTYAGTTIAGTAIGDVTKSEHFTQGIVFTTDIFCTLSGTGAYVYVLYEEIQD